MCWSVYYLGVAFFVFICLLVFFNLSLKFFLWKINIFNQTRTFFQRNWFKSDSNGLKNIDCNQLTTQAINIRFISTQHVLWVVPNYVINHARNKCWYEKWVGPYCFIFLRLSGGDPLRLGSELRSAPTKTFSWIRFCLGRINGVTYLSLLLFAFIYGTWGKKTLWYA